MSKKKKLLINCELCDARKIREKDYSNYEEIVINAELLLQDEASKSILSLLPVNYNVERVLELDQGEELEIKSVNGYYELGGETDMAANTALVVNGTLQILPGTQDVLRSYHSITVNGLVRCPKSLESSLTHLMVNGSTVVYPDDCVILEDNFAPDKYFALRAKEGARYYTPSTVVLAAADFDAAGLVKKQVQFVTKRVVVPEERVEECLPLFDETVALTVVPSGYQYAGKSVLLDEQLLNQYGTSLYIDGDLTVNEESLTALQNVEKLIVTNSVKIVKSCLAQFQKIPAQYKEIQFEKGLVIEGKLRVRVDELLLEKSEDGVRIQNVANVILDEALAQEKISEKLQISNCAKVQCAPSQQSAVELISENVMTIGEGTGETGILDMLETGLQITADTKLVNAEKYML